MRSSPWVCIDSSPWDQRHTQTKDVVWVVASQCGLWSVRPADSADVPLLEMWLEIRWSHFINLKSSCAAPVFAIVFLPFLPSLRTSCSDLEESEVSWGHRKRPELNLNQKVEVKRCSKTGNQQDVANQPHSTFALIPSSSSLILPLSCFSHCWHSFLFPEIVCLLSYLARGQLLRYSLWHSNLITASNPIVANAILMVLKRINIIAACLQ